MNCPTCGRVVADDRNFCPECTSALHPPDRRPTGASYSDVQTVDLARVPAEMRAPTTWTIAKGVFLGLFLWSLFSAAVAIVVFAVAFSQT